MSTVNICSFYLGERLFGLPTTSVQEIKINLDFTEIPLTPDYIIGILNLRGQVVLTIDLIKRLGFNYEDGHGIVSIIVKTDTGLVCFNANQVGDVFELCSKGFEPTQDNSAESEMILGVYKLEDKLLHILDANKIADIKIELPLIT